MKAKHWISDDRDVEHDKPIEVSVRYPYDFEHSLDDKPKTKNSKYCYLCCKSIYSKGNANYRRHYRRVHPDVKDPLDIDEIKEIAKQKANQGLQTATNDRQLRKINDCITLSGCGYTTQWQVPKNLTRCPNKRCRKTFENRSNLIEHFKKMHADSSIYCTICECPIGGGCLSNFLSHYKFMHRNVKNPLDFEENAKLPKHQVFRRKRNVIVKKVRMFSVCEKID